MKLKSMIIVSCTLLLLAGCRKGNDPESPFGSQSVPVWEASADVDITKSMTAVVRVDLSLSYTDEQLSAAAYVPSEDDMLAAFSGTVCLSLGEWNKETDAWWLYIAAPEDDGDVTFRYYSASLQKIFVSVASVPFHNDTRLGSVSTPYTPQWTILP